MILLGQGNVQPRKTQRYHVDSIRLMLIYSITGVSDFTPFSFHETRASIPSSTREQATVTCWLHRFYGDKKLANLSPWVLGCRACSTRVNSFHDPKAGNPSHLRSESDSCICVLFPLPCRNAADGIKRRIVDRIESMVHNSV